MTPGDVKKECKKRGVICDVAGERWSRNSSRPATLPSQICQDPGAATNHTGADRLVFNILDMAAPEGNRT